MDRGCRFPEFRNINLETSIARAFHDMNNVNHAIMSCSQLALQQENVNEELRALLQQIHEGSKKLASMVSELDHMRTGADAGPELFDVNEVVRDAAKFYIKAFKGVFCQFSFDETIQPVYLNRIQINRVIGNLVVNAAHAMMGQGIILVSTKMLELGSQKAGEIGVDQGGWIQVAVRDHGCGIADADKERIFEEGFTTKETGKGIGLASALSIIEAHGGTIRVESELQQGSTFFLYLPFRTTLTDLQELVTSKQIAENS